MFKKLYLYFFSALLLIYLHTMIYASFQNINRGMRGLSHFSISEYKSKIYGHMVIDFINSITKNIDKNIIPFLIYPNHPGDLYGVAMLLDGYRTIIDKNILIFLDGDKPQFEPDEVDTLCKKELNNNILIKECKLKEIYTITGIQFKNSLVDEKSRNIIFSCKDKIINFDFNRNDFKHSTIIPYNNLLKIPYKDNLYQTIASEDCNNSITISIDNVYDGNIDFNITGVRTANYDHFPVLWDKKDARNYLAIKSDNFEEVLKKYESINNLVINKN